MKKFFSSLCVLSTYKSITSINLSAVNNYGRVISGLQNPLKTAKPLKMLGLQSFW